MAEPIHSKDNNFGTLRLLFASLVIFSHSPSILTGNTALEPRLGPMTLGEIGVDGFFLISGYLIAKSFIRVRSVFDYFRRRVLRIYPAFIVNGILCIFILAPMVGAGSSVFHPTHLIDTFLRLSVLNFPRAPGIFPSMPMPALNGSSWSIPYEFRCYLLVVFLGIAGAYRSWRMGVLIIALACLVVSAADFLPDSSGAMYVAFGSPAVTVRMTGVFMVGMLFYLYREHITYNSRLAVVSAVVFAASVFVPVATGPAYAIFGGYLIFWFAMRFRVLGISRFTNETDLSYGIYLYAWPVQMTIAFLLRSIPTLALSFAALALSAALAYLSWTLVEKPALRLAHRGKNPRAPVIVPQEG